MTPKFKVFNEDNYYYNNHKNDFHTNTIVKFLYNDEMNLRIKNIMKIIIIIH